MAEITSLDDDVLLAIFENAAQVFQPRTSELAALLNLSRTCRRWRDLVASNARFWTRIVCIQGKQTSISIQRAYAN